MSLRNEQRWKGGVCEGLVVDSEEAKQRLKIYGHTVIEFDGHKWTEEEDDPTIDTSEEMDFLEWLLQG